MKPEGLKAIYEAYDIEQACIGEMKEHIDPEQFGKAMLFPAMVETYAILALLISILAIFAL